MDFLLQYKEGPRSIPSIVVPGSAANRFRDEGISISKSLAMAIPGTAIRDDVPPPLPPPRILPFGEVPTSLGDHIKHEKSFSRHSSFASRSSLASGYGSMSPSSYLEERPSYRRMDVGSVATDEGYASYASIERSRDSLSAEFGLHHNKFQFQSAADLHCNSMKQKLDLVRTSDRSPPSSLLASSVSNLARGLSSENSLAPTLNMPIQLPIHSRVPLKSRSRDSAIFSAVSPQSSPYHPSPADRRSPYSGSEPDRSPQGRQMRNNSDDATSTQGSLTDDMVIEGASSLKRLHIDDAYTATGHKRRAASPASDNPGLHKIPGQTDIVRRRDGASRGSPAPRLSINSQAPASVLTSASQPHFFLSTTSISSSVPTVGLFERGSPSGVSPGALSSTSCSSPYITPASLNPSPRASTSSRALMHTRTASGSGLRKLSDVKPIGTKFFFMCECCPKKPKKFGTPEELSAHEAEKQYECSFCGNRFKNKNEAERHQNSLHVRHHSWSCSALSSYNRAFHESTTRPGEADACGYCGEEFPRSGCGGRNGTINGIPMRHATEQDWEERIRHLQEVHKFRECNSSKKFYRADHFRQHLKHSHAGTSGKWTNMLENACLIEESPTPR